MRFACLTILAPALAACGGDSGNVMAADANMLSPEQVDMALGPEIANDAVEVEIADEVDEAAAIDSSRGSDRPTTQSASPPAPEPETEPEPEEEPAADTAPPANNITEE